MVQSKDLFDDSTMSFGEHLEALRGHLWKALLGLSVAVIGTLFFGNHIIAIIRAPIDAALLRQGVTTYVDDVKKDWSFKDYFNDLFGGSTPAVEEETGPTEEERKRQRMTIEAEVAGFEPLTPYELASMLHEEYPALYPEVPPPAATAETPARPAETTTAADDEQAASNEESPAAPVVYRKVRLKAKEFAQFKDTRDQAHRPITLNVQEAFLTYIKVSVVAGILFSSPWILYQIWLFVAAGLYPHERKYVHMYLPLSIFLFVGGAVFCFLLVFPFVLNFLLGFNQWLDVVPQIRLSEWISFAIMLPMMFGLSFQLPLVMLFLDRINVFSGKGYREKRRMAIFIISIVSMVMTPADPMSMMLMMIPLVLLYEFGIILCDWRANPEKPFDAEPA